MAVVILLPSILDVLIEYFPALKRLSSMYLEGFLCIYKDKLRDLK